MSDLKKPKAPTAVQLMELQIQEELRRMCRMPSSDKQAQSIADEAPSWIDLFGNR